MNDILAGLAGSLFNSSLGMIQSDVSYKKQKKLMDKAYQQQREFYEMKLRDSKAFLEDQRRYDSIVNKKRLFKEAGYDLGALLQNGGSVPMAGTPIGAPDAPMGGIPSAPHLSLEDPLSVMQQVAQTRLINAQANKEESTTPTRDQWLNAFNNEQLSISLGNEGKKIENDMKKLSYRLDSLAFESDLSVRKLEVDKIASEITQQQASTMALLTRSGLDDAKRREVEQTLTLFEIKKQMAIVNLEAAQQGIRLTESRIEEIQANIYNLYTRGDLNRVEADLTNAKVDEVNEKITHSQAQRKYLDKLTKKEGVKIWTENFALVGNTIGNLIRSIVGLSPHGRVAAGASDAVDDTPGYGYDYVD